MDVLTNKTSYTYTYTSRYTPNYYYYHTIDKKYFYGVGSNMNKNIPYATHTVKDSDTFDSIALYYYNNPSLYWLVAYFNDIEDVFSKPSELGIKTLNIPKESSIKWGDYR